MTANADPVRFRLAKELRALLSADDEPEETRLRGLSTRLEAEYGSLMDSDDELHEIYHYVADADVRAADRSYDAVQRRAISRIIDYLERVKPDPVA